jgi:hypothetical protein
VESYPKVLDVEPKKGRNLLLTFNNGVQKIYDCTNLLDDDVFKPLRNDAFFNAVNVDKFGYGVVWNDDLDLSESELCINGLPVD